MAVDIKKAIDRSTRGKAHKAAFWNNHWQLVHEFFLQRKADFTNAADPGAFLNSDVWTGRPGLTAETASSAMLGMAWPDNRSFSYEPYGDELKGDAEVEDWFEYCTEEVQNDLDDPRCGLQLALEEVALDYLISQPALMVEAGEDSTYRFDALTVRQFSMDEGPSGRAEIFDIEKPWTVRNLVAKYGIEKVSEKVQKLYADGKMDETVLVLQCIEPRKGAPQGVYGPKGMAWSSAHIEVETKHLLLESGYHELPVFAPRFSKRIGEKYARTPAMRALPDVLELNEIWEMLSLAVEKIADPALYTFFSDTINTSAGALNAPSWNADLMRMMGTNKPIMPVQDVGDIRPLDALLERLDAVLNDHFMIDRLIDQNTDTQMTAREFIGRQGIRQMSLRSPLSRLTAELFDPKLERCFNISFRAGKFGYAEGTPEYNAAVDTLGPDKVRKIPRKIVEMAGRNKRVYRIRYNTPAALERRANEAQGILNWTEWMGTAAEFDRTVLDEINTGRTSSTLADIWSVPQTCKNTPDEKKALQKAQQAAAGQDRQLQQAQQVAEIAATGAKAKQGAGQKEMV